MSAAEADPLSVVCPFCGVDVGIACCTTDRGGVNIWLKRNVPHKARFKAADRARAEKHEPPSRPGES